MSKTQWKEDFAKSSEIQEKRKRVRLEKEKPVFVRGYSYIRNRKEIIVDTYRRKKRKKKPKFKKFKK